MSPYPTKGLHLFIDISFRFIIFSKVFGIIAAVAQICPWSHFSPATYSFWEERLCRWVAEPANTWSNLAYIFVGLYLLMRYRKIRWSPVKFFAWVSILVGISSGMYHASCTFAFQCADLGSMFLVITLMFTLNIRRIGRIEPRQVYPIFWGGFIAAMAVLLNFHTAGRVVFVVLLAVTLSIEGYIYFSKKAYDIKPLLTAIIIFGISYIFWQLDIRGVLARPDNHVFQGHAMWHVVNSFAFIYLYKFYDQFQILSPRRLRLIEESSSSVSEWLYGRMIEKSRAREQALNRH